MNRRVVVIGHADADGHLIAEQVRRNLSLIGGFDVRVVVDPMRTKDHKTWTKLNSITEIEHADLVFFVDLMFGPTTFAQEATALVDFVHARPEKMFFLLDHHPLPLRRLSVAKNLRMMYRPDVCEIAFGPRSGMMVVAAICENQAGRVGQVRRAIHDTLALAMRRAAAHGGELPGEKLMAVLRSDQWRALMDLGNDDRQFHHLPRGRRVASAPQSHALSNLNEMAEELLSASGDHDEGFANTSVGRDVMAYDYEVGLERVEYDGGHPSRLSNSRAHSKDLEAIVTLLEVAALSLTTVPSETFTLAQLIREAQNLGGGEVDLDERDIKIVLEKTSFIESVGGELRLR